MKTAKEMFEELGYKEKKIKEGIVYSNKEKVIIFWGYDKTVSADCDYESMNFDMKTLKIIVKKCEELGWLDE